MSRKRMRPWRETLGSLARELGAALRPEGLAREEGAAPRRPGRLARVLAREELPADPRPAPESHGARAAWLLEAEELPFDALAASAPGRLSSIWRSEALPFDPPDEPPARGGWRAFLAAEELPRDVKDDERSR